MPALRSEDGRPRPARYRKYLAAITATLLLISLLLHLWVAGLTHPVAPQIGDRIQPPKNWSDNRVTRFRVATYNIHRGKGLDGICDIERIAHVLEGADIVGINEAAGPSPFGGPDQMEQLGKLLDMGWLFAANQYRWYRPYFGNGLLSRFPVSHWFSEPLLHSEATGRNLRNMITARVPIGGTTVTVMVTHLDRGPIREQQLRYVIDEFRQNRKAILMGDFNTDIDHPRLRALIQTPGTVDAIAVGLGRRAPKARGDWIITRDMRVLAAGMTPAGASDHPAFWVDLALD